MGKRQRRQLLKVLLDGESYGLELANRLGLPIWRAGVWLRSLEELGLVSSREGEPLPERGNRPRYYYELTAEGRRIAESS